MRRSLIGKIAFAAVLSAFSVSPVSAEINDKTAIKIGISNSDYRYGAFFTPSNSNSPIQTVLIFSQSEPEFGFLSPKKRFFGFYVDGGVNFHSLKQTKQRDCSSTPSSDWEDCPTVDVPESSFITMREFFGSLGYEFGPLSIETSLIYASVQGNYYLEYERYAVDEEFIQQRLAAILETELFDWFAIGADGSIVITVGGGTKNEESGKSTYLSYTKISAYIKFLW